jgi:hypothetical protein
MGQNDERIVESVIHRNNYARGKGKNPSVTASEFARINLLARERYESILPRVVTSFHMEPTRSSETTEIEDYGPVAGGFAPSIPFEHVRTALESIPFPCIRIVRTVLFIEDDRENRIDTEVICFGDGEKFGWCARDRDPASGKVYYSPTGLLPDVDEGIPASYIDLIGALSNNSARYIEKPVSRQVRRASGFADGYREYIVIDKPTKEQRATAMRLSAVMRRHPRLHAVRGHLRHYKTGLTTFVKPHARGKGDMLQVKTYVTQEEYYTQA